ncbi:hypothetical protein [Emticicia sp. C21]|uniref:hypothetical protein n=1 Tax=Emticicia sp. C21 TaxID=2302915 RepID=UPI000E3415D7|nr:hypothetical protein [Emticicia sp. C21]RFS17627.1 hypothetical protein D0T08_07625 [Emticicia sp. C21]
MQAEEFYNKIRENLDNSDFTPDWNKSEVWQRIEQKDEKKKLSFWWGAVAASIVLVSLFGGYLLLEDRNTITSNPNVKNQDATKSARPVLPETTTATPLAETPENITTTSSNRPVQKRVIRPVYEVEPQQIAENEVPNEEFDNMVTTEGGEQEFSYDNVTSRNEPAFVRPVIFDAPIIFRPNKVADKPATAPVKRERVAILEIPEDHEDYVIAPKEKKKKRHERLAKQVEKTPEATDPDKPNKIWAFVKQSFKNETMPADSTIK